jgi:hypothetical protein
MDNDLGAGIDGIEAAERIFDEWEVSMVFFDTRTLRLNA